MNICINYILLGTLLWIIHSLSSLGTLKSYGCSCFHTSSTGDDL